MSITSINRLMNIKRKKRLEKEKLESRENLKLKLNYPKSKEDYKKKIKENLDRIDLGLPLDVPLKILNGKLKNNHFSREYVRANRDKINKQKRERRKKNKSKEDW